MADNVTYQAVTPATPPDATVVSTDQAGDGSHIQRVKLAYSADGVATHATVDADGVLVNLGANNDITGSVTANAGTNLNTSALALESGGNLASVKTAVEVIDNIVQTEDAAHSTGDSGVMVLGVRKDSGGVLSGADGDYTPVSMDAMGRVRTIADLTNGITDSFGHILVGGINNQVDIQYYRSDGSVGDLVTETNTNGGTATASNGMATFAATTTANSRAKGVSNTSTTYTAGAEVYCLFTAGFTGAGSGTSYHRIGLYDDNNGFFIGYEGNTFGVTIRKGASDTQTAKASWIDPLTGGASSQFTRSGVPEAVDLTKLNVWRIRFGWVGSAPIKFEILSPDGKWVTFHEIKQPNLAALPSVNNADLPVTCDVNSGNSSTALTIITNCWCAGTTQSQGKLSDTLNVEDYAQLVRSVITGYSTAGGGAFVNVKVNPSGAMTTDSTISSISAGDNNIGNVDIVTMPALPAGTNNIGDVDVLTLPALAAGTNNIGDVDILTIAAGDNNIGNVDIVTMPNVTLAAGTNTNEVVGDVAHSIAAAGNPLLLAGISQDMDDTAPPNQVDAEGDATRLSVDRDGGLFVHPHGPRIWSYHENSSSQLTDTTVHAAPAGGLSLYVTDIIVSTGAATAMNVFFEEGASTVLGPYYLEATAGRGFAIHFNTPKKITAATALTVSTSAAIAHSIDVTGFTAQG